MFSRGEAARLNLDSQTDMNHLGASCGVRDPVSHSMKMGSFETIGLFNIINKVLEKSLDPNFLSLDGLPDYACFLSFKRRNNCQEIFRICRSSSHSILTPHLILREWEWQDLV